MPRDLLISASEEGDDPMKCKFTGVESLEDLAVRLGEKLGLGVEFWRDARGLSTQAAWRLPNWWWTLPRNSSSLLTSR